MSCCVTVVLEGRTENAGSLEVEREVQRLGYAGDVSFSLSVPTEIPRQANSLTLAIFSGFAQERECPRKGRMRGSNVPCLQRKHMMIR